MLSEIPLSSYVESIAFPASNENTENHSLYNAQQVQQLKNLVAQGEGLYT